MENIIDKIDTQLIEKELTKESFLRNTNKGGNQIYVVDSESAPNIMLEIGRLRELAFRAAGGGTGKACDIDMFDTMTPPCRQLIVWNPVEREIIGGYRFLLGSLCISTPLACRASPLRTCSIHNRTRALVCNHRLSGVAPRLQVYIRSRQPLGRAWRAHNRVSPHQIHVWEIHHVSQLSRLLPRHDSLFLESIFP